MIKETHQYCEKCKGYGGNIYGETCQSCKGDGIVVVYEGIPNGRIEVGDAIDKALRSALLKSVSAVEIL